MQKTASQIANEVLEKTAGRTGPVTDVLALLADDIVKSLPRLRAMDPRLTHPSKIRDINLAYFNKYQLPPNFPPGTLGEMLTGEGPGFLEAVRKSRAGL